MTGIEERRRPWRFLGDSVSVNRRAVLAAFFGFAAARLSAVAAAAAPPAAVALTPQDNADLQRIAAYLGSIRTMYAKFRQVASGGGIATGQLWMARPGRMRFEYDPPSPNSAPRRHVLRLLRRQGADPDVQSRAEVDARLAPSP